MNRIYRLCWNAATAQWVAASELARNSRPAATVVALSHPPRVAAIALAVALALTGAGSVHAGQTGGQIVSGNGAINHDGLVTTINQNSQRMSLNWQTFDIAANETVNFVQPGRYAIAVNRVFGNNASEIFGHLNANGQVWLINPNGVLFGQGAQVNVGGLVASTLDTDDASLSSDQRTFSGAGKGSVVNKGSIRASQGGYVALLGNTVSNQGTVMAQLGTVAMGGGTAVTLTFAGSQLVHMQVDRSTLDNLVENRQLVQADGGRVFMTAGAADSLLASTVNNTGVVRAQTVENRHGEIVLLGGMKAGHVQVEGTLDASAPAGGDGGSIETSGAFAQIGAATITASAPSGKSGTWLVDPYDLTIDKTAADTISATLNGGTSVTEQTTATGTSGAGTPGAAGVGDINVNSAITWTNAGATLTLDAYNAVNINAPVAGAGQVVINAHGTGGSGNIVLAQGGTISADKGMTLSAAGSFVNHAGANALTASAGNWLVYSASPLNDTRGGLVPQFVQYNAVTGATPLGTGNGFLYQLAPTVTVSGLAGTVEKTYDGNATATLTGTNYTTSGLVNDDRIATATGTYASADAASGIRVTSPAAVGSYTFTDASGLVRVYGYQLAGGNKSADIGVIDPKQLAIAIVNNPTKTYNGTTTATLTASNYSTSGLVAGENITFGQPNSVAYDSASAGSTNVTANFVPSNFSAASGTKLSNYVLPATAVGMGTIDKAKVQLSGLLTTDKVYDGTTVDSLDKSHASIFGVIAGDTADATLDASAGIGAFADVNVGNGKSVSASGFRLVGGKASNYELVTQSDLTAGITPKTLTIANVSATSKVYDASTSAQLDTGSAVLDGVVAADVGNIGLLTSAASGTFATKNVGAAIGVTASGFSLTGTGTGNYTLVQPLGLRAGITQRHLGLSIVGNPTRVYNGTTTANVTGDNVRIDGLQGADTLTVAQASLASYAGKDAGQQQVTAHLESSDFQVGNGTALSNYSFDADVRGLGTIAQAPLTWTIVGNPSRQYDGTTNATLAPSNYQVDGFIDGEGATVTRTQGAYAASGVGTHTVTAAVDATDFSPASGTLLSNYILPSTIAGFGTITARDLSGLYVVISGYPVRAYDGTANATLVAGSATNPGDYAITANGSAFAPGEGVYITQTAGTYAGKNVGVQPISVALSASDYHAIGSTDLNNYTPLPTMAFGTGEITRAILTASIVGNPTKVYNGTTYIALDAANYLVSGFAANEGADIEPSKSVSFDTKDVGTGKTVTAQMATTSYVAHADTLLSNYQLALTASGPGSITVAPLYVVGVSANNRTYDATNAATLNSGGASLVGLVAADANNVSLTAGTTGTFASSDAGVGKAVTALGFGISGREAANYQLQPLTGLTATIDPFTLTIRGVAALNKVYDGTSDIGMDTQAAALEGVFAADNGNVSLDTSGAVATTRTPNAANGLDVETSGFALSGGRSANYRVEQVKDLSASITKRPVGASITGNPTKGYDGSTSVTLLASDYTLTGFVSGQGASIPQSSTARYNSANAGTGIGLQSTLSVSDFVASGGTNLANYDLPVTATGTLGTITPFVLNLMGTRVYDATTDADASLFTDNGTVAGVNGERVALSGTGDLVTKNVGTQRAFLDFGTLALGDNGASLARNYTLNGGIDWVTITPATLTVANTVATGKVYDATTVAQLSGATLTGVLGSDNVVLGNASTGTFASKNVGTRAVTTRMTVSGDDMANYVLVQPTGVSAAITPLAIDPVASAQNKQYDGSTSASASVSSRGVLSGDTVTFASTSRQFDGKDVANGRTVTVNGITKSGADAGNYSLNSTVATTTANITPRVLNLTGTRVYDATTGADAGSLALGNLVSGESLLLSGSGVLGSKNVGTYTRSSGFGLGTLSLGNQGAALASNYTLAGGVDSYKVTPAALYVTGTVASNKTYDGNTAAALRDSVLNGVLANDTVALTNADTGAFDTKNVGTAKTVTTSMAVAGADAGNYLLTQPSNVRADITARSITVDATGVSKVYDGSTTSAATLSSDDIATGDRVTFEFTGNSFADKNVGTGKAVTVTGITSTGADAANYTLGNTLATTVADITPYVINLIGTRVYDASTTAAASLFGTAGTVNGANGETLSLTGSGITGSKNVGSYHRATDGSGTFGLGSLALVGNGGAAASNYSLAAGVDAFTITPYALAVAASGVDKVYDATTGATVTLAGDVFQGDRLDLNYGSARFSDKNAATGKQVSVDGIAVTGADAGNYTWNTAATTSAAITPRTISGAIVADDKVYDAGTLATTHGSLTGVIAGDDLAYTGTTGRFADKNVGTGKTVNVSGIVGGTDVGNYRVVDNTVTTAAITPAMLTVSTSAQDKVYDGETSATAVLHASGVLAGDEVGLVAASSDFAGPDAATGVTVTSTGISGFGADAGNYVWNTSATTTANIVPYILNLTGTRVYDGSTVIAAGDFSSDLRVAGIRGDVLILTGSGDVGDKNVGVDKSLVSLGTLALQGEGSARSANYTLVGGSHSATITPKQIVVNATGSTKVYDGNTVATAMLSPTGVLDGDQIVFTSDSISYGDKNVGTGKTVTAGGIVASGTDATNYVFETTATTTGDITPRAIDGNIVADSRTYDGTTLAQTRGALTGGIAGDELDISTYGAFVDKDAGLSKAVDVKGTLTGSDARNYVLSTNTHTRADIYKVVLGIDGTRVYDGTVDADAGMFGRSGVIDGVVGETLTLSGTGVLPTKNVATEETLSGLGSLALAGNDGARADNYTLIGGTHTATITPRWVTVGAAAQDKRFDGNTQAVAFLTPDGVLEGDTVEFVAGRAIFAHPAAGPVRAVAVDGIHARGTDAGNYVYNTSADSSASIMPSLVQGTSTNAVTQIDGVLRPESVATPYGVASKITVGQYSGNHKKTRTPLEKNTRLADFVSGLSLQVIDGGVRLPSDVMR